MRHELCEFRWLHIPYEDVKTVLRSHTLELLQPSARAGVRHAGEVMTTIDTDIAGHHLERDIIVVIGPFTEIGPPLPIVKVSIRWHAVDHPGLYPVMDGMLEAYPISADRTQISLQGHYQPPFGKLGDAIDSVALHRIAESSVEHFLEAIAERIRAAWDRFRDKSPSAESRPLIEPEAPPV